MYNRKRTFKLNDDDTLYEMMRMHSNLSAKFNPIVEDMNKLFDFTVAALQWDPEVRKQLRDARRPANSYNMIRTIFNIIFSIERDNRKKGNASPRTGGDNQLASVVTQVLDFYLYHTKFTLAQKRVFMDKITARLGVYYMGWLYDSPDPYDSGRLFVDAVDPREIMYEPVYNDPYWSKAGYIFRKHELGIEEILNKFALNDVDMQETILDEAKNFFEQEPGKRDKWVSKKLKNLFSAVYETAIGADDSKAFDNYLKWWNPSNGKFDILELHEKRTERRLMVPTDEGKRLVDITEPYKNVLSTIEKNFDGYRFDDNEAIQQVQERYGIEGEPRVQLEDMRFTTAVIPAFNIKVNEQPYPFKTDYYVYIPDWCYDNHADPLKAQSVMDDLLDPQAHFNKAQSLILELLGRYANKGWVMDENAIEGLEEDWMTNRIAPYRRVRAGYINMIKPEEGQTISPELVRMPAELQALMKIITNADDEIRGQGNADVKSGKHFIAKEKRQVKSFSFVLENSDLSHKVVLEQALNFVQHFVQTQQVFRITQDAAGGKQEKMDISVNQSTFSIDPEKGRIIEQVANDLDAAKYDIEMSQAPFSATAQEEKEEKLGNLFNAALAVDQRKANVLLSIIAEIGDYPESERIIAAWDDLDNPSDQQQQLSQMMQQIQMIMAKLGIEKEAEEVKGSKLDNLEKKQRIKQNAKENALSLIPSNGEKKQGRQNERFNWAEV